MKKTKHGFRHYLTFKPRCILEAGVGPLKECRSRQYWDIARCVLFEPVPKFYQSVALAALRHRKVHIYPFALWSHCAGVSLVHRAQSSYVQGVTPRINLSAAAVNKSAAYVQSTLLSHFDEGDFDVVLFDMEAAEWAALSRMTSRPKLLSIEMWQKKPEYRHPHFKEIMEWIAENNYTEVGRDLRDSFFVRS